MENEILNAEAPPARPPRSSRIAPLVGLCVVVILLVSWLLQQRTVVLDLKNLSLEIPAAWTSVLLDEPGWENRDDVPAQYVQMIQDARPAARLMGDIEWFGFSNNYAGNSILMIWRIDTGTFFGPASAQAALQQMRYLVPGVEEDQGVADSVGSLTLYRVRFRSQENGQNQYYWMVSLDGKTAHYLMIYGQDTDGPEALDKILHSAREKLST